MNGTSRIVHRLRLRAPSESAIHRAVVLFEDALRTASLPDTAGRMVIVRRLALGRIDSRVAPQMVALRLERAFGELRARCVYAGSAGASAAPAVWFRDALDAHTRLALRLAAGDGADDWYWRLAVKAWEPGMPLAQALREIVLSLASVPEARVALPQWAAAMAREGHAGRMIDALRVEDVPRLASAAALRIPDFSSALRSMYGAPGPQAESNIPVSTRAGPASAAPHGRFAGSFTGWAVAADPRRVLLKALVVAAGAAVDSARYPLGGGSSWTLHDDGHHGGQSSPTGAVRSGGGNRYASSAPGGEVRGITSLTKTALNAGMRSTSTERHGTSPVPEGRESSAPAHDLSWVAPESRTHAGGLLFLVPVLARLGYPEWLEAQPVWARYHIAQRVLTAVLTRLRVAPEDPAWRLASYSSRTRRSPRRFVAPARWHDGLARCNGAMRVARSSSMQTLWDGTGRLLLGAWTGRPPRILARLSRCAQSYRANFPEADCTALVTEAWIVAARRWLRRSARIGLADLVLRPAILSLTPTHADLELEMDACELRIRRAGLDLDPGWVPWFGRVVRFHYR